VTEKILEEVKSQHPTPSEDALSHMGGLHRAILSLSADLSLEGVLERIVSAARELAHARYAALGLVDADGNLTTFITEGISEEEAAQIPHQPAGEGLIGEMIRAGESLRVAEIADDPRSVGFPPGHPVMRSFLGVRVAAYGRPLGQIYLTDKEGASEFSVSDQQAIEMLAAHAAAAIENARLYQQILDNQSELEQRNEELEVSLALSEMVSSQMELVDLLRLMLQRVSVLFGADAAEIHLRNEDRVFFKLALHYGDAEAAFREPEVFHPGEGWVGTVGSRGQPLWTSDLANDRLFLRKGVVEAGFRSMVSVPLRSRGEVLGVLSLAFYEQRAFNEREIGLLEAVGAGAGITIANARLTRQARRVAVLEERERIAMDLHDGIIQSIYAVGLTLESSRLMQEDQNREELHRRLTEAIDELNDIIRDLRNYILDLQPSRMRAETLDKALRQLGREFAANTATDLELTLEPEALLRVPEEVSEELYLIAQEALANVAKHANASKAWLNLRLVDGEILLQVIDNGHGFDVEQEDQLLGHGLSNMVRRASAISGSCDVVSSPGEGTTLTVRLGLSEDTPLPQE
jgi:two-component system sensor histidine kinase DevS